MLLSQKTSVKLTENAANFIGHMCYAAYKLSMSVTMNATIIRNSVLRNIQIGIIRRKHGKIVCGLNSFPPRQHKRSVNFWTNHGSLFMY